MPRRISKELTRKEKIDPQLKKAGWGSARLFKAESQRAA
jgi:hypothetical protein